MPDPHVPSPLSPRELAQLKALVAARGSSGEPADLTGFRILGRARDIVPAAVDRDDDSLLFLTPEGALVVAGVRDDGTPTYMRLDLNNNLHVIDANAAANLNILIAEATQILEGVDATTSAVDKLAAGVAARGVGLQPSRDTLVQGGTVRQVADFQGHPYVHGLGGVAHSVQRMYVGTDAGAYTSPVAAAAATDLTSAITFTGVNLLGLVDVIYNVTDRMYHTVTAVVDPAGGGVGTLTVAPAIPSANAVLRIPYESLPHAYDPMSFALRGLGVNQPQDHVNGPARLVDANTVAPATYDYDVFVNPYALITVQAEWANQAAKTGQLDFYARLDDNVAGTWTNVNGFFTVAGAALGVAVQNGQGLYVSTRAMRFREFRVEYIKVGAANIADTVEIWQTIGANV